MSFTHSSPLGTFARGIATSRPNVGLMHPSHTPATPSSMHSDDETAGSDSFHETHSQHDSSAGDAPIDDNDSDDDISHPVTRRKPQPINSGIANRHKRNRLFNPPREIEPSVTSYQGVLQRYQQMQEMGGRVEGNLLDDASNLTPSLFKMLHDAIIYYTKTKRIKIISNYELYQTVGRGAFSKVKFGLNTKGVPRNAHDQEAPPGRLARSSSESSSQQQQWMMPPLAQDSPLPSSSTPLPTPIACKIISIDSMHAKEMQAYVMREIAIMRRLNHPNVVKFVDVVKSENNIYLFVELISAGDLMTRIKSRGKLSEATSRRFFVQLIRGLEYCHKTENIAHRDLKPQNILVDETPEGDVLKISDFGLAAIVDDHKKKLMSQVGTIAFMSPEVRLSKSYNGFAADVYSCGMILYTMLCGQVLRLTDQEVRDAFTQKELKIDFPAHFSSEVKHLLSIMLDPDPKNRIELSEIRYHPWCIGEFKSVEQKEKARAMELLQNSGSSNSLLSTTSSGGGNTSSNGDTGSNASPDERSSSPLRKRQTKPTLKLSASTPKNLNSLQRQRSNSDESTTGTRPNSSSSALGRKRTSSLSKVSTPTTMRRKRTATISSPLTGTLGNGIGAPSSGSKNTAATGTAASVTLGSSQPATSISKSIDFYIRKKKMKEAIVLVETVLEKLKCFVRADTPAELSVLYRYTDSFEKRVTLKYTVHFSIFKLGEGTQCTKVEFRHLSGELFAFRKSFKQVKKELSSKGLTIDSTS